MTGFKIFGQQVEGHQHVLQQAKKGSGVRMRGNKDIIKNLTSENQPKGERTGSIKSLLVDQPKSEEPDTKEEDLKSPGTDIR